MSENAAPADESEITFPEGLPGFDGQNRFVIVRPDGFEPILFFQAVEDERIRLPVVPAETVEADYHLAIGSEDCRLLGFEGSPDVGRNALCLLVLVLADETKPPTCNLFAPIVVNVVTRRAKQILQLDSDYEAARPLLD